MSETPEKTAAIIVAAGSGSRVGGAVAKQWQSLAGKRVIDWTIEAFQASGMVDDIVIVTPEDCGEPLPGNVMQTWGGPTRAASVQAGLDALANHAPGKVLIHDAARPCVSVEMIDTVVQALDTHDGAAPGLAVSDALWRGGETVSSAVPRDGLFRAQTPQGFRYDAIRAAHTQGDVTAKDDVELAIATGMTVAIVPGSEENLKITTRSDFSRAERILQGTKMDIRLGHGYDVHAFEDGNHVVLCGVEIPFDKTLKGHSDADVAMHAATDAIYGALADGDIGQHFPPSDPQWKGAASHIFLDHAVALAEARGFAISNVDCTLVCEQPKIGPHAEAMRKNLSALIGIELSRISVKATTSERLGFTGREEGIAAFATATLVSK